MAGLAPMTLNLPGAPEAEGPTEPVDVIVQSVDDDGEDLPQINDKGQIVRIEHADGSVTISMNGQPLEGEGPKKAIGWFDNLAMHIDGAELLKISDDLIRAIDEDITSRTEWVEDRANGIKLLGLKLDLPGIAGGSDSAPVEGMSKVRHPLLLEAVLRFQANASAELLPADGPLKIRNDDTGGSLQEDQLANALEKDMNHYLTAVAKEYYPDTDRMLLMLGFGGTSFKKVYFCPLRLRPVSESIDADDLIVNNSATDLANARRITHRTYLKPSTIRRMQILGYYRDIELGTPTAPRLDSFQREEKNQQGQQADSTRPDDRDHEIYECHCELDIPGFEFMYNGRNAGLEVPYRVTIDVSSREILSIVRNYDEHNDNSPLPVARTTFVKFPFVPGLGFYDIGLLNILGNTTNAITAAWRELLDAGMYANFPGFLMSDAGGRQNTNIFRVPPGGGAMIKTGGVDIRQAVMPLPYQQPSMALMQLVQNMAETGMRIGGTSEQQVGEGRADAPVGTTLAMIEQAVKVMNAVHKRLCSAQAQEFELIMQCFKEHPESFVRMKARSGTQWTVESVVQALSNVNLVPRADPNTASQTQRIMKVMALKELQKANPSLYDPIAIDIAAIQVIGYSNPQQFMAPPAAQASPPPELQKMQAEVAIDKQKADASTMTAQAKAQEVAAKIQSGFFQPKPEGGGLVPPEQQDPFAGMEAKAKLMDAESRKMDAETKRSEMGIRHHDLMIEDKNRDLDRESRERVQVIELARDIMLHPDNPPKAEAKKPAGGKKNGPSKS